MFRRSAPLLGGGTPVFVRHESPKRGQEKSPQLSVIGIRPGEEAPFHEKSEIALNGIFGIARFLSGPAGECIEGFPVSATECFEGMLGIGSFSLALGDDAPSRRSKKGLGVAVQVGHGEEGERKVVFFLFFLRPAFCFLEEESI